jgi:hypothetical protein
MRPGARAATSRSASVIASSEGVASRPSPIAPSAARSSRSRVSGAQLAMLAPAHHITAWWWARVSAT